MEWLSDEEYNKGLFLVQGAITEIMAPLRAHGQGKFTDDYITGAIIDLKKLHEDFGLWVRGQRDKPISAKYVRRKKKKV